jgi:2-dehydropantoate 2-reductase
MSFVGMTAQQARKYKRWLERARLVKGQVGESNQSSHRSPGTTESSFSPRFCIVGSGAIGGTIASLLLRSGASVSVVARGDTLAAVKRDGLRLVIGSEALQAPVRVSEDPSELGVQDYVIIAVKAPSLPDLARRIGPLLGPETAVVTAMNGVPWWFFLNERGRLAGHQLKAIDPEGRIAEAIPAWRVIGCAVHIAASVDEPGQIHHKSGRRLLIGEPNGEVTTRVRRLAEWLHRAGLDCRISENIRGDIWFKLWGNLSMNPISLLTSATSDRIIADPLARKLCVSMMGEAAQIGKRLGISVHASIDKMLEEIRGLGSFKTSMLQDMERGKVVEIDAILTVTHDIGLLVGEPTPAIDAVLGLARLRAQAPLPFDCNFDHETES